MDSPYSPITTPVKNDLSTVAAPLSWSWGQGGEAWRLRRSDPERARTLATQMCGAPSDARTWASGLLVLAFCDLDRSMYALALKRLSEAQALFAHLPNFVGSAGVTLLQGIVNLQQGNYENALAHLSSALEVSQAKSLGLEHPHTIAG